MQLELLARVLTIWMAFEPTTVVQAAPINSEEDYVYYYDNEDDGNNNILEKRATLGSSITTVGSTTVTFAGTYSGLFSSFVCPSAVGAGPAAESICYWTTGASLGLAAVGMGMTIGGVLMDLGDDSATIFEHIFNKEQENEKDEDEFNEIKEDKDESENEVFIEALGTVSQFESFVQNKVEKLREETGAERVFKKIYSKFDKSVNAENVSHHPFIEEVYSVSPKLKQGDGYIDKFRNFYRNWFVYNPTVLFFKSVYGFHVVTPLAPFKTKQDTLKMLFKAVPQPEKIEASSLTDKILNLPKYAKNTAKAIKDMTLDDFLNGLQKLRGSTTQGFVTYTFDISANSAGFWAGIFDTYTSQESAIYEYDVFLSNGTDRVWNLEEALDFNAKNFKTCTTLMKKTGDDVPSRLHTLKNAMRGQVYLNTYGPIDPECHSLF